MVNGNRNTLYPLKNPTPLGVGVSEVRKVINKARMSKENKTIVPPIKCQGIKTKLIPFLKDNIKINDNTRWIEPFLGSGAVLFNLQPQHAILSDRNPYIIELYKRIQDKTITSDSIKVFLEEHGKKLAEYGKEYYHYMRDEFNKNKDVMYFLFLNRSCFSGLIRFNKKGEFNVSFGNRQQRFSEAYITKICNQIDDIARIMEGKDWVFDCCDWRETIKQAQEGDVVYLDPPYIDRATTYFAEWTEKDNKDLVEFAHQTEADVYLSMWKESNLKKNEWLWKNWSDLKWIEHKHQYTVGGTLKKEQESNNKVIEVLAVKEHKRSD